MPKVIDIKSIENICSQCSLSQLCLPRGLSVEELRELSTIVKRERQISKGDIVYEIGQPFNSLYAIRIGSVKVLLPMNDGEEKIVGFHMPGELLGFDGMGHDKHCCTAVALESTSVCELPYNQLLELAIKLPNLGKHFMTLMSNEIADDHAQMLMLTKKTAEARIATFLLNLSARFRIRGFSEKQFNLRMSRNDIANYLGLAVETVSRIMTRMQEEGIIDVNRRFVNILNMQNLRILADIATNQPAPCGETYAE